MNGDLYHCQQGTTEWIDLHRGVPSASNFSKIVTATGKKCAQWNKYLDQCVDQIVNGMNYADLDVDWMLYGKQYEDAARAQYAFMTNCDDIHDIGFIMDKNVGCSPDALVERNGKIRGLEIKCPKPSTHIGYIRENRLPLAYFPQVQGSLWITGLDRWDFFSYPATDNMESFMIRVTPDDEYHKALDKYIPMFIDQMHELAYKVSTNA